MAASKGKTTDGTWRPNKPFNGADGVKVTMRREPGVTRAGVLKVPLRFQCPPINDLTRPHRTNWSTYDTIGAGQRSRPMGQELLDLSIDTLLMDRLEAEKSSNVVVWDGRHDPERVLKELRFIASRKAVFRLVLNQPAVWNEPLVNVLACLTNVQPTQRAGHLATEWLSLAFLEWQENPADRQARQHRHVKQAHRHPVRMGVDTLYALATTFLHRASDWKKIAKANGITGVSANDADELEAWCKRHHKTVLIIPGVELQSRMRPGGEYEPDMTSTLTSSVMEFG